MLAGVQLVRMSAKSCAAPPESSVATAMPMAFLESFSVATVNGARQPFQSKELHSSDSVRSKLG